MAAFRLMVVEKELRVLHQDPNAAEREALGLTPGPLQPQNPPLVTYLL